MKTKAKRHRSFKKAPVGPPASGKYGGPPARRVAAYYYDGEGHLAALQPLPGVRPAPVTRITEYEFDKDDNFVSCVTKPWHPAKTKLRPAKRRVRKTLNKS